METGYQRGKIQEESMYYEYKRHDSSYPIIGVNTFLNPKGMAQQEIELARSSDDEKQSQIRRLRDFQARNAEIAPAMLEKLKQTVIEDGNVFAVLVDAVKCCSLGQISSALYEVGGQYRRSDVREYSAGERQPGPDRVEEKKRRGNDLAVFFEWLR